MKKWVAFLVLLALAGLAWAQRSNPTNAVLEQYFRDAASRGVEYANEQLAYTVGQGTGGGGNLSSSGSPSAGQVAQFTDPTHVKGSNGFTDSGSTLIATPTPTIPTTYMTAMFNSTSNAITASIQACNSGAAWDQWFKDATGQSAVHTITLTPSAGTIDGAASAQIGTAYGAIHLHSNGVVCVIL